MPLLIDAANTPAAATGTTAAITSGSFTPAAGSLVVLLYAANHVATQDTSISSVTNTGTAVTWTRRARKNPNPASDGGAGTDGGAEIWTGVAPGGAITVTANGVGTGAGTEKFLKPVVLTGADTATLTNIAVAFSASGLPSVTVAGCVAGSHVLAVSSDWQASGPGTAGTAQTMMDEFDTPGQMTMHSWRTTNVLAAPGSQTMNLTAPPAQRYNLVAIEIRDAGGGVAPDAGNYTPAFLAMPGRGLTPIQKLPRLQPATETTAAATAATGAGDATTRPATTGTGIKAAAAPGAPTAHPATTATTTGKAGQGQAAAATRATVTATGNAGTPNGPAAATQHVAVTATGVKGAATTTGTTTQRSTTTGTGLKQATAAGTAVAHTTTSDTTRKQATGTGNPTTHPASQATTTTVPTGAGQAHAHPATTTTGTAARNGAGRPSPHPVTAGTGTAGRAGTGRPTAHATTTTVSGRAATGTARPTQRATVTATGFAPPPYEPILVGLDGATTSAGQLDGTTTGGGLDTSTTTATGLIG